MVDNESRDASALKDLQNTAYLEENERRRL